VSKFRKKPVVIEAMHFTDESKDRALRWAKEADRNCWAADDANGAPIIKIKTLEGIMAANLGDWIIKGVKGELYPCKPDVFELTYEEA